MKNRWTPAAQNIANVKFQLAWCTMFRCALLEGPIKARLSLLLYEKAKELGCQIESCEIKPDHVVLVIDSPSIHSAHYLVQQFKGYSSRHLRQEFSIMRSRVPSPWTRAYYCTSLGRTAPEALLNFTASQPTRCDSRTPDAQISLPLVARRPVATALRHSRS